MKGSKTVFPDGTIKEDEIVASGNKVAVRFTFTGTHRGPLPTPSGTLAPTGRTATVQGVEFFTFTSAGKVAHIENLSNALSVVFQLSAKE